MVSKQRRNHFAKHQIGVYLLTTLSFLQVWMFCIQAQALLQLQKAVTENSKVSDK